MRSLARSLVSRCPREIKIKRRSWHSNSRYLEQGALNDIAESKFLGRFCAHRKCRQMENSSLPKQHSGTNVAGEVLNTCSMRARQNVEQLFIDESSKLYSILLHETDFVVRPSKNKSSRSSNNSCKKNCSRSSARCWQTNMVKFKKQPKNKRSKQYISNEKLNTLHKVSEFNNHLLSRKTAKDINKSMFFSKRTFSCIRNPQCENTEGDNYLEFIDPNSINHLNETSVLSHYGSSGQYRNKFTPPDRKNKVWVRKKLNKRIDSLLNYCRNKCRQNSMYNQKNTYSWRPTCSKNKSQNETSARSLNGLMDCLENIECPEWRPYDTLIKKNDAESQTRLPKGEVKSRGKAGFPPVKRNAKQKVSKNNDKKKCVCKCEAGDVHLKNGENAIIKKWHNECTGSKLPSPFFYRNPNLKSKSKGTWKENRFFQTVECKEIVKVMEGCGDNYFNEHCLEDDAKNGNYCLYYNQCSTEYNTPHGGGDTATGFYDENLLNFNADTDLKILKAQDPFLRPNFINFNDDRYEEKLNSYIQLKQSHKNEPTSVTKVIQQATTSCNEPTITSCNKAATSSYNEPPVTSYNEPPVTSYNEPPVTSYNEPVVTSYNEQTITSYNEPAITSYNEPSITSYNKPVTTRAQTKVKIDTPKKEPRIVIPSEVHSDPFTEYLIQNAKRYSDKANSIFNTFKYSSFPKSNWRNTLLKCDDKLSEVINISDPKCTPCPIKVTSNKNPSLSEYSRITVAIDNVRKRIVNAVKLAEDDKSKDNSAEPNQHESKEKSKCQKGCNNEANPIYLDRLKEGFKTAIRFQPPSSVHLNEVIEAIKDNKPYSHKARSNTNIDNRFRNRNMYGNTNCNKYHTYTNEFIVNTVLFKPGYHCQNLPSTLYNGAHNFSKQFNINSRSYSQNTSDESIDEIIDRITDEYGSKRQDRKENQSNFEQDFTSVNGKGDTSKHTFTKVKYLAENQSCRDELENKTFHEFTKEHFKDKSEYSTASEIMPEVVTRYHSKHKDSKRINGQLDEQRSCTNNRKWKAWNPEEWKSDNSKLHSEIMSKGFYSRKSDCDSTDNVEKHSFQEYRKKSIQSRVETDDKNENKGANIVSDNDIEKRYDQYHPSKTDHSKENDFDCFNVGDLGLNFTSFELEKPDNAGDRKKNENLKQKGHHLKKIGKSVSAFERNKNIEIVKTNSLVSTGIKSEVNNANNLTSTKKDLKNIMLRNSFSMDTRPSLKTQPSTNKLNLRQASSRTGIHYNNFDRLKKIKKIDKVDYTREERSLADMEILETIKIKESYLSPPSKRFRDSFIDNYGLCSKEVVRKKFAEYDDTAVSSKHISEEMKVSGQFPEGKRLIRGKWLKVLAKPRIKLKVDNESRAHDIESATSRSVNSIKQPHSVQHLKSTTVNGMIQQMQHKQNGERDNLKYVVDPRSNIPNKHWTKSSKTNIDENKAKNLSAKAAKDRRATKYDEEDDKGDSESEINRGWKQFQPDKDNKDKKYFVELRTLNKNIRKRIIDNRFDSLDTKDAIIRHDQRISSKGQISKLKPQIKPKPHTTNEIPANNGEAKTESKFYITKQEKNEEIIQDSILKNIKKAVNLQKPAINSNDHRITVIDKNNHSQGTQIEGDVKEVGTQISKTSQNYLEPKATGESKYEIDSEAVSDGLDEKLSVTYFKQFPVHSVNNFAVEATMLRVTTEKINNINRLSNKNVVEIQSLDILTNQVEKEFHDIVSNLKFLNPRFKKDILKKSYSALMTPKEHFLRMLNANKTIMNRNEVKEEDLIQTYNNDVKSSKGSYNSRNTAKITTKDSQKIPISGKGIVQKDKADLLNASILNYEVKDSVDIKNKDKIQVIDISKESSSSENTKTEPSKVSLMEHLDQVKGDKSTLYSVVHERTENVTNEGNGKINYQNKSNDLTKTTGSPKDITLATSSTVPELSSVSVQPPQETLTQNIVDERKEQLKFDNENVTEELNIEGVNRKSEVKDLSKEENLKDRSNETEIKDEEYPAAKDTLKTSGVQRSVPPMNDATKDSNTGSISRDTRYYKAFKSTQKQGKIKTDGQHPEAQFAFMAPSFNTYGFNNKKMKTNFYKKREKTIKVAEYKATDVEDELQRIIYDNSGSPQVTARVSKKRSENFLDKRKKIMSREGKAENVILSRKMKQSMMKEAQIRQVNLEENEKAFQNLKLLNKVTTLDKTSDVKSNSIEEWVADMCEQNNAIQEDIHKKEETDKKEVSDKNEDGLKQNQTESVEAAVMASDSNQNQAEKNDESTNWPDNLVRRKEPVIKQPLSPSKPPWKK